MNVYWTDNDVSKYSMLLLQRFRQIIFNLDQPVAWNHHVAPGTAVAVLHN